MNLRHRSSPEETRLRIMDVAEEHFRRVGYAKTAVADLAQALSMSPANIYRFFPSKGAINDAICRRMMNAWDEQVLQIVNTSAPASERLRRVVLETHRHNRALMVGERRIHDMVEVAMAESWDAVEEHVRKMEACFATLVRQGQAAGEFALELDPDETGGTIYTCCCALFHPTMINQHCVKNVEPDPDTIVAFVLRALKP